MVGRACSIAMLAIGASLAVARPAVAMDGRYVGTYVQTDIEGETRRQMRHLLDVGARRTTTGGVDMRMRTSLNYSARPREAGTDLLRSRFIGELRAPVWRLHGEFVPWQDAAPGDAPPRARSLQLGLDLTPRRLPQMVMNYVQQRRQTLEGLSASEDGRIEVSYAYRNIGTHVGYRHLETEPSTSLGARSKTDEWRASFNGSGVWRRITGRASYDLLQTAFRSRARVLDQRLHRLNLNSGWSLEEKLFIGATALARWGGIDDNQEPERRSVDERSAGLRVEYRPFESLTAEVSREYRQRQIATGSPITDYTRGRITFQRYLARDVEVQSGYQTTFNLRSEGGDAPANTVYALVDGRLTQGLDARGELRASRASGNLSIGTQWRRLVQLRSTPSSESRVELTWRSDTLPSISGLEQSDRQWDLTVGYFPQTTVNLTLSLEALDGHGRVERTERAANLTAAWQMSRDTRVSTDWSRRRTTLSGVESGDNIVGFNLKSELGRGVEGQLSWRQLSGIGRERSRAVAATLSRNL